MTFLKILQETKKRKTEKKEKGAMQFSYIQNRLTHKWSYKDKIEQSWTNIRWLVSLRIKSNGDGKMITNTGVQS